VAAPFDDPSGVHHEDLVCFTDGREPVGDHDRSPSGEHFFERPLHRYL
jgi:hypothetical protein